MIQNIIFFVTAALMMAIAGVFIFVALNASKNPVEYAPVQVKAYSIRTRFFWILIVVGILISVISTLDLPYAATRGNLAGVTRQIDVEGRQWYWKMSSQEATAGDTVVFNVTTGDVNHGLGIYDPDMRVIGQTQAMPGYSNSLKVAFEQPGTYKFFCMEYCGLAHHAMVSEFTVNAK